MNKDKQRIAIAKACGWEHTPPSMIGLFPGGHKRSERALRMSLRAELDFIPDYLGDLNAMHEAEKVLALKDRRNHALWLADKCGDLGCIYATADQRAEAFLRTLGKWEEEP